MHATATNGNGRAGGHHARRTALRRVLAGSVVGTALEWYDFFIYGTAAALVFGDLFFNDKAGTGVGTLPPSDRRRVRRAPARRDPVRQHGRPL